MKKRNGFTLIELLAVIVILAIIAVIAVPIVLNIIDDSKKNSTLRSADFYLDAVEMSVANSTLNNKNIEDGSYNILSTGNICLGYDNDNKCNDELVVEVKGEHPKEGTIVIESGEIVNVLSTDTTKKTEFILNEQTITKNSKNEIVYVKTLDEVCTFISGTPKSEGAKYECKVDPDKEPYTFYILNTRNKAGEIITETLTDKEAVSINLIMNTNINSDGTPVTKAIKETEKDANDAIYNIVPWINESDFISAKGEIFPYDGDKCWNENNCLTSDKGPITAMNFLLKATKKWTNVNEMIINTYTDQAATQYNMKEYNVYARMPYYIEVDKHNSYLIEFMSDSYYWEESDPEKPENFISDINGYWTLSTNSLTIDCSFVKGVDGSVECYSVDNYTSGFGVRPVINLNL